MRLCGLLSVLFDSMGHMTYRAGFIMFRILTQIQGLRAFGSAFLLEIRCNDSAASGCLDGQSTPAPRRLLVRKNRSDKRKSRKHTQCLIILTW